MEKGEKIRREKLAGIQHEIWAHWMSYLFSVSVQNDDGTYTIPSDKVKRWKRQIATPYDELSEHEKDGDREQAEKVVPFLQGEEE
jgi:hypothetical protein